MQLSFAQLEYHENRLLKASERSTKFFYSNATVTFLDTDSKLAEKTKHDVHHLTAKLTMIPATGERKYILMLLRTEVAPNQIFSMMRRKNSGDLYMK